MLLMKEVMREQLSVIKGHRNGEDLEGEGQAQDLQVSWKELQNSCLGLKGNLSPKDLDGSYDISINLLVKGSPLLNNAIRVFFLLKRKKKPKTFSSVQQHKQEAFRLLINTRLLPVHFTQHSKFINLILFHA